MLQNSVNNFVNTFIWSRSVESNNSYQEAKLHTILQKLYLEAPVGSCRLNIQLSTLDAPLEFQFIFLKKKNLFWMIQHCTMTQTKAQ